jgi:hypothetical protein
MVKRTNDRIVLGEVCKVSRYGDSAAPTKYQRARPADSEICIADESLAPRGASINDAKPKPREVRHFAAVSCMSVRAAPVGLPPPPVPAPAQVAESKHAESSEPNGHHADGSLGGSAGVAGGNRGGYARAATLPRAPLILVGRVDGSVDLFHMDDAAPVQSWDLTAFTTR